MGRVQIQWTISATSGSSHRCRTQALVDPVAGTLFAGLSFGAVADSGSPAEERARVEYYLCNRLMDDAHRCGLWYEQHPVLDPGLQGRHGPGDAGPAPVDSFAAKLFARGAEAAAGWHSEQGTH